MFDVVLYYCYTAIEEPETFRAEQEKLCSSLNLTGRCLVATEGINGTLAGDSRLGNLNQYVEIMKRDPRFASVDWKTSASEITPFPDLSVRLVNEIVGYGKECRGADPRTGAGTHLSPTEFHTAVQSMGDSADGSTVLLDVRNAFENEIGHFEGSTAIPMRVTSEFPTWVKSNLPALQGKKVNCFQFPRLDICIQYCLNDVFVAVFCRFLCTARVGCDARRLLLSF